MKKIKRTESIQCAMCKKIVPPERRLNYHHLSYRSKIVVPLCFVCHCIVHCRLQYHSPYKKYGDDYGAVHLAKDILELYEPVLAEIRAFKVGGHPK